MRRPGRVGLLLAALAAAPAPLPGQEVAQARAQAERLLRDYQATVSARARSDSLVQRRLRSDTVRAGALTLVTPQASVATVRRAAALAWPVLQGRYGPQTAVLSQHLILLEPTDSTARRYSVRTRLPDGSVTSQSLENAGSGLAAGLQRFAELLLWQNADSALRAWYPAQADAGLDSSITAERVYLELVTSPSVAARSCLIGDDRACAEALGLVPVADPLTSWYDPGGRRALVRRAAPLLNHPPYQVGYVECVEGGSDPACLQVLRAAATGTARTRYDALRIPDPVGDNPRLALVREVVQLGGSQAWGRLVGSAGRPLPERLALAAAVSSDSLMRAWRSALLAARPRPVAVGAEAILVALGWAAFGVLFAMGASRWH